MVEAVGQQQLQPFTTIKYTTKDGENVTATKNDGVVTLVGDKNGVRQMPVEDFFKNELPRLEKSPEKDTVELSTSAPADKTDKAPAAEVKPEAEPVKTEGQKLDVAA